MYRSFLDGLYFQSFWMWCANEQTTACLLGLNDLSTMPVYVPRLAWSML